MSPAQLSIIATGNIVISGNPDMMPDTPGVLFVTDMDLRISGNFAVPAGMEGQMLVREQVSISGNSTLAGQLLVEGVASVSPLVTSNTISGSTTLVYNGSGGTNQVTVSAWRWVQ